MVVPVPLFGGPVFQHGQHHFHGLFLRGRLMEQVEHKGGVQSDLAFLPKRIIGVGPFWGGVADEIGDQLQHVGVAADVVEGIIAIAMIQVHKVDHPDHITLPEKQRHSGAGELPLWVRRDIGGVGLVDIGLHHIPGLAGTGTAHHDLEQVSQVLSPV